MRPGVFRVMVTVLASCGRTPLVDDGHGELAPAGGDTTSTSCDPATVDSDAVGPGEIAELEPNDSVHSAHVLTLPVRLRGTMDLCDDPSIGVAGEGIDDIYVVYGTRAGMLHAELLEFDPEVGMNMYVLTEGYALQHQDFFGGPERAVVAADEIKNWIMLSVADVGTWRAATDYLLTVELCAFEIESIEIRGCASGPSLVRVPVPELSGDCRPDEYSVVGAVTSVVPAVDVVDGAVQLAPGEYEIAWRVVDGNQIASVPALQTVVITADPSC